MRKNLNLMKLALRGGIPTGVFTEITEQVVKAGADLKIKNKNEDTIYSNVKKVQYEKTIEAVKKLIK